MTPAWNGTKPRILLIEDEPMFCESVTSYLNIDGFECHSVNSAAEFRAFQASGQQVDVMVFDLGLPDGDGLDTIGPFAEVNPAMGIVIVSARGSVEQRVEGLNRGADVYLPKPVDLAELSAVLKRLAKRVHTKPKSRSSWSLDSQTWILQAPTGASTRLTLREKIIMELVMAVPGLPVSRDVLAKAWGFDSRIYDFRRMESMVRRLRNKCEHQLGCVLPLATVYGHGFVFNIEST